MIELNSKNGWRAAFILLLWSFVFHAFGAILVSEICGTVGGLLFAFMIVYRWSDVVWFMEQNERRRR